MARNVEIKAHVRDPDALRSKAESIADGPGRTLVQCDTFFVVPKGRLKLREFVDGAAELIAYRRPNSTQASISDYTVTPVGDPTGLKRALTQALGERGVIRKTRRLYRVGPTRIHLDHVEGLGNFVELEVVLTQEQSLAEGRAEAERHMQSLGIVDSDLIDAAYIDLWDRRAL